MTRLALVADLDRCTGCCTCMVACAMENGVEAGASLIRLVKVGPHGRFPDLTMYYVPIACQQCGRPTCAESCPEGAIRRDENGVVTVDARACSGCGVCAEVCPYEAITVREAGGGQARKCDLCAERLAGGSSPACLAACPAQALRLVDLDACGEEEAPGCSPPRRRHVLKVEAGTDPSGWFLLDRQEWRDLG